MSTGSWREAPDSLLAGRGPESLGRLEPAGAENGLGDRELSELFTGDSVEESEGKVAAPELRGRRPCLGRTQDGELTGEQGE